MLKVSVNGVVKGAATMRSRQTGITFIGFVMLAALVGILGFAGLKLTPAYLENMKIKRLLGDVKEELSGSNPTPQIIRRSIDKRINIEMIYDMDSRDFEIQKSAGGMTVAARYEKPVEFIGNISLVASFDDEVEIP
jgi:hypothetical protein